MKRALLTLAVVVLSAATPCFAAPTSFPLELTNESGSPIKTLTFIPLNATGLEPSGPAQEVTANIAARAKAVLSRPADDLFRVIISTEANDFTFPVVSFFAEEATAASLVLRSPDVPLLEFKDAGDVSMVVAGNNSQWGFKSVLTGFPYGPGVTTLQQARAWKELSDGQGATLKGTLVWEQIPWQLTLTFAGTNPESTLDEARMYFKLEDHMDLDGLVAAALEEAGYVQFACGTAKNRVDAADLAVKRNLPPGDELAQVFYEACESANASNPEKNETWFAPRALFNELLAARKNGTASREHLAKAEKQVLAGSIYNEKADALTIVLSTAGNWAKATR